ncbi:MAG: type 1 pili tip component [Porticoccaceae bacterium]|nr:type 1 pili tip component [Porticoccaceae bacterium]
MKLTELLEQWNLGGFYALTDERYSIQLPIHDVARLRAFAEMYPNRTETQMITDLLRTALDGLEESLPYIQGNEIIGEDEFGNPIFNDAGLTPLFTELKKKYSDLLTKKING